MPLLQVFLTMAILCLLVTCGGMITMLYYVSCNNSRKANSAFAVVKDAAMFAAGLVAVSIFGLFFL